PPTRWQGARMTRMSTWLVCRHPQQGWRILTPSRTQAGRATALQAAITTAERIIADEGGGLLEVADGDSVARTRIPIARAGHPYRTVRAGHGPVTAPQPAGE